MVIQNSKFKIQNFKLKIRTFNFLIAVLTFNFLLLTFVPPSYAQDTGIGEAQITPASPLYFLKSVREILELNFAKTDQSKAELKLGSATRRIKETNSLVKTSRQDLIQPTLEQYLSNLKELVGIVNLRNDSMALKVSRDIILQMNALQAAHGRVSNQAAQRSIRATINRLTELNQDLIDRLNIASQSALAAEVLDSRLSGCNFLSKEASSSVVINDVERAILSERAQKCLTPNL